MPNMSYCMFQNTYRDLGDAYERMQEIPVDELSESEQKYRARLIELCKNIADEFGNE